MEKVEIVISNNDSNLTIKEYLKKNNVGRGKIEEIRVNKASFLNGVFKPIETKILENDVLSFQIQEKVDFLPLKEKLDIVYEDDYILIINKPSGFIIYPDDSNKNGTLVNIVANYYLEHGINRKVRYIHRLDKETSGIILFAKDFLSEAILLKELKEGLIDRRYLALVEGKFEPLFGLINASIKNDEKINNKMMVSKLGKEAITKYKTIETYGKFSLVEFSLITGRTHQIRVHCSYLKHPLLGDVLYNGDTSLINRVALHSYFINFIHPIKKNKIEFKIDLAFDMKGVIKK